MLNAIRFRVTWILWGNYPPPSQLRPYLCLSWAPPLAEKARFVDNNCEYVYFCQRNWLAIRKGSLWQKQQWRICQMKVDREIVRYQNSLITCKKAVDIQQTKARADKTWKDYDTQLCIYKVLLHITSPYFRTEPENCISPVGGRLETSRVEEVINGLLDRSHRVTSGSKAIWTIGVNLRSLGVCCSDNPSIKSPVDTRIPCCKQRKLHQTEPNLRGMCEICTLEPKGQNWTRISTQETKSIVYF